MKPIITVRKPKWTIQNRNEYMHTAPGVEQREWVSLCWVLFDQLLADRKCGARFSSQSISSILGVNYLKKISIPKADITTKASKICEMESEMCSRFRRICLQIYAFFSGLRFRWLSIKCAISTNLVYTGERGAGLNLTVKVDFGSSSCV